MSVVIMRSFPGVGGNHRKITAGERGEWGLRSAGMALCGTSGVIMQPFPRFAGVIMQPFTRSPGR